MTKKTDDEVPPVPSVGRVRWVLVCALRNLTEAERRGVKVRRVFYGIDNRRAVAFVRRVLRGRANAERSSLLTWQVARWLANATPYTAPKAYYNATRWLVGDRAVFAQLGALVRGEEVSRA